MKVIKKLCRTMYNLLTSYSNILSQKYYWGVWGWGWKQVGSSMGKVPCSYSS